MAEPKLRFKRDNGSSYPIWQECKLDKILTERNESHLISEDAPLLSFTIEQGVIYPENKKTNKRDFLMKDKDNKKFLLTEYNDIIYNPANLKFGAIHRNALGRGVVSPIYAIFYTNQVPDFIEGIVTNPKFIKRSLKYLEGTVIKLMTLKPKDFLKMKVFIPCPEEQQKIADFLSSVNEVIAISEQEVAYLEMQKKAVMKKIFSQEVRFKKEDGSNYPDWEDTIVKEIGVVVTGNTPSTKEEQNYGQDYLWVTPADITKNECVSSTNKKLSEKGWAIARHLPAGAVLVTCIASIGKNSILATKGSCNQQINAIIPNGKMQSRFILEAINYKEHDLQLLGGNGGMKIVSKSLFENFELPYPCPEEQQKIADFLSNFDEAIVSAKKELELWKQLKKGLLQQMFV